MIKISNLQVTNRFSLDFLVIMFDILDTEEKLSDYRLDLYRSNGPEGPFEMAGHNLKTTSYKDYDVNLKNDDIEYYYKINVVRLRDGFSEFTETVRYITSPVNNYTFFIKWNYDKYLDDIVDNGNFYLMKKIRSGQLCPYTDEVRGACKNPRCTECYGTGYLYGYYAPIKIKISFQAPSQENESVNRIGITNDDAPYQVWCGSYPIIAVGDILVGTNQLGGRYKVISVTQTTYQNLVVSQRVVMQTIAPTDIAYSIPMEREGF